MYFVGPCKVENVLRVRKGTWARRGMDTEEHLTYDAFILVCGFGEKRRKRSKMVCYRGSDDSTRSTGEW